MEGARDRICIALDTCADQNLGGLRTLVKRIRESSGHLRSQGVSRAKVPWAHDISGCSVGSTHPLLQTACVAASLELRASGQVECMARMLNHRHWLRSQGSVLLSRLALDTTAAHREGLQPPALQLCRRRPCGLRTCRGPGSPGQRKCRSTYVEHHNIFFSCSVNNLDLYCLLRLSQSCLTSEV